jgi:hypothetical protein
VVRFDARLPELQSLIGTSFWKDPASVEESRIFFSRGAAAEKDCGA